MEKAQFSSLGHDLFWKIFDDQNGLILWTGYNDAFWWERVAPSEQARRQIGKTTKRVFEIDFQTCDVQILEA